MGKRNHDNDSMSIQDYNQTRQALIDAGLRTASREEWIERTGQDPLDPTTWNNNKVDQIRAQQNRK
ncbi:MAG: hypothetical protein ACRDVE_07375 [Actinocrinis sp.]